MFKGNIGRLIVIRGALGGMNEVDFMNYLYQQKSYGEVLHSLGVSLDDVKIIPFTDGKSLIADLSGNAKGFINENVHGGVTITDENMNMIGSTQPMPNSTFIHDQDFQQTGILYDNVHGGANLYDSTGQLEMMSTENLFYGRDYYDASFHLLGSSEETINHVTAFSMIEDNLRDMDVSFDFNKFSDYLSATPDWTIDGLGAIDFDIWAADAVELFDLFDLF